MCYFFFFFNDTATTEIYTLSLHDALPISVRVIVHGDIARGSVLADITVPDVKWKDSVHADVVEAAARASGGYALRAAGRSEEHTSELQSRQYLVCRLLLEKKKKTSKTSTI